MHNGRQIVISEDTLCARKMKSDHNTWGQFNPDYGWILLTNNEWRPSSQGFSFWQTMLPYKSTTQNFKGPGTLRNKDIIQPIGDDDANFLPRILQGGKPTTRRSRGRTSSTRPSWRGYFGGLDPEKAQRREQKRRIYKRGRKIGNRGIRTIVEPPDGLTWPFILGHSVRIRNVYYCVGVIKFASVFVQVLDGEINIRPSSTTCRQQTKVRLISFDIILMFACDKGLGCCLM